MIMRTPSAREAHLRFLQRAADKGDGVPRQLFHTVASRITQNSIADSTRLPVFPSTDKISDGAGHRYFQLGYSQIGGPDIIR